MWETLLWLVAGAVLGFLPTWLLSNRSHKWDLEERKRERAFVAREVRLKEGEEKIKDYTREFDNLMAIIQLLIRADTSEMQNIHRIEARFEKTDEEMDKGRATYEISVASLGDEELTNTMEKVSNSFDAYKALYFYLSELLKTKGIASLQNEHDKNKEEERALVANYLYSVKEFLSRINELRSQ